MEGVKNRLLMGNMLVMSLILVSMWTGRSLAAPETAPAFAPVPTTITYQGRLLVADGTYDFTFSLWDAATVGKQIGPNAVVADAQVKATAFSVALNFGPTAFNGDARWLEVSYRPGASTGAYKKLSSRASVFPTPYALSLRPGAIVEGAIPNNTAVITANTSSPGAYGLKGFSQQSAGVFGQSTSNWGVYGRSSSGQGVYGETYAENTSTVAGVYGKALQQNGIGVIGDAQVGVGWGVYGQAQGGVGVRGTATNGSGVRGSAASGIGVWGNSTTGSAGVYGQASGATASGVEGNANGSGATGVYGKNPTGRGVWGFSDSGTSGVFGQSNGAGASGVEGYANGSVASAGVYGRSSNGVGVWGRNESGGYAMKSEGHATQSLQSGGWVKAMAGIQPNGDILRCFNATLSASAAATLPCGITVTKGTVHKGDYTLTFPFQVNTRFLSVTPLTGGLSVTASIQGYPSPSAVRIRTFNSWLDHGANEQDSVDTAFFIIVY